MARFIGIPEVPDGTGNQWVTALITAMKQNVELLAGIRGEADKASQAVLKGDITIRSAPRPTFQRTRLTADGSEAYTLSGAVVAGHADYRKLVQDVANLIDNVQRLANDVENVRRTLNALTDEIRR